jgi:hypothetical protein
MMNLRDDRHFLTFILRPSAFSIQHSAFILFLILSSALAAQEVVRLPAVEPAGEYPPGLLVSHPDSSSQILQAPGQGGVAPAYPPPGSIEGQMVPRLEPQLQQGTIGEPMQPSNVPPGTIESQIQQPKLPPGVRNGFFQKALFDSTWLAPGGSDGMGMTDIQLQSIFAAPCPTINSPLIITPGFAAHYLQGPQGVDLPPHLFEGYAQFRWMSQVTPKLGLDFAFTPGIFSDFDQESGKAMRYTGHGAAAWTWNETTKFVVGGAYLDRPDVEFIPIGGIVWTPCEDVKYDLVFPHPRISHRVYWAGNRGEEVQDWAYLAVEFTGDAWAIRHTDGSDDLVVLSDYRIVLGIERKVLGGLSSRFEIGYVFGRRIRFRSDLPDFHPTDTIMLRGGLTY